MQNINTLQLKNMMEQMGDELTIINTLDKEHFADTQIPGSINIPWSSDQFVQEVEKAVGGRGRPVVVYCASVECDSSKKAAEALNKAGFDTLFDYEGGAKSWQESGSELVAP